MCSVEPASRQVHTQQSGLCPHIIGQVRLGVYHDAIAHAGDTGLA
jgi:hypothetical protein